MPQSPASSLFASDYSLSPIPSPGPSPSLRTPILGARRPTSSAGNSPLPGRSRPLEVVFPYTEPQSPLRVSFSALDLEDATSARSKRQDSKESSASSQRGSHAGSDRRDKRTPSKSSRDTSSASGLDAMSDATAIVGGQPPPRRPFVGYVDFESCMEGAQGHARKAASYPAGSEKAFHHLMRAKELLSCALRYRPNFPQTVLEQSKILIALASTYQRPAAACASLEHAISVLRDLLVYAPRSVSARNELARACALLGQTLLETEDSIDGERRIWAGEVGELAREALALLEDVAADRMDRVRTLKQHEAAEQAPSLAEMFLALSSAAISLSSLAVDASSVDLHVELSEQALDQASNMANVAASAKNRSSFASAILITRVQLASGQSSLERLRHSFMLGADLDEDDFRSLISDISILATECRERAVKLKGSRAAAAHTLAWEAISQLGGAKLLYANLLRLVWRKRRPRRKTSVDFLAGGSGPEASKDPTGMPQRTERGSFMRKMSRSASVEAATIQEEEESSDGNAGRLEPPPLLAHRSSSERPGSSFASSSTRGSTSRKSSGLDSIPDGQAVSQFTQPELPRLGSLSYGSSPALSRRGSWLPPQDQPSGRTRRMSSMSAPLAGPDGVTAWSRKASVIGLATEESAEGMVPSAELAKSAWQLLESGVKQYKLALSALQTSDLPPALLARAKADTLISIAYSSLFAASLAPRLAVAREKRTSLLVTAEVYATWAAREVGWSFLIEGSREAAQADRRTNSWRADESGKRAVMLLLRVWWYRAVTTEHMDMDTKMAAKDVVEVVVRRMKDREGVTFGDVTRWTRWLGGMEGEMDAAEALFWRSVSRILRGGSGFVMAA